MTNSKMVGMLVAAFLAGSLIASPELRAYASTIANDVICNGCVGTSDMAGNAVTSVKIKDGEVKTDDIAVSAVGSARIKDNDVKAQDLAPDSVGASELQGVTKLIFATCSPSLPGSGVGSLACSVPGARVGDRVIATFDNGSVCAGTPVMHGAKIFNDNVVLIAASFSTSCGSTLPVSLIVFK
jgi:hypothetical protein